MPRLPHSLLNYLHAVSGAWRNDPREDAELLARFASSGDEAAFKALVWRHGPLVWRSCTRVLGDGPDAEDAFQTAFLALAHKAGRFPVASLAGWLYRVARQAALKVDIEARRRRNLEHRLRSVTPSESTDINRAELYAALDEELAGLPERLRIPLVLRHLEGKTLEDAARIVGCSRRDLGRRLARGEAILRERLERRGLAVSVGSVAVLLGSISEAPAVPARLIGSTARAAVAFRSGTLTGRAVETARAVLGTFPSSLETMILRKSLWIVLACLCSFGVGLAAWQASSAYSEAVETPGSVVSLKEAAEPDNGQVDCYGDPLPSGALARLGTLRLRHVGMPMHALQVGSVIFSRDGKMLFTVCPDNPIRLWDAATGKLLRSFGERKRYPVTFLVLSPDGRILATSNENGSVSLWEVATGKPLRQLGIGIYAVTFSRDGRTLLSASTEVDNAAATSKRPLYLRVWEVATGKEVRNQLLPNVLNAGGGDDLPTAIFSPDGKSFASIHQDNVVYLWEAASGKGLCHLSLGKGIISQGAVAFSPDSRFLTASSFSENGKKHSDGAVHLLEVATGKVVRKWMPDKSGTRSLAFSPDGKLLATGSAFGPLRLWDVATGKEVRRCQDYQTHIIALAFSPDGRTLASLAGKHDYTTRLWEVTSGKERLPASRGHVGPILSVAFSPDGKSLISTGRDGLVGLWNPETGQQQNPPLRVGDFQALAVLAPDGKTILTVGNTFSPNYQNLAELVTQTPTQICVWDRATGQKVRQFPGPVGAPQSLALSPDGKILVLRSLTSVHILDVATGKEIRWFKDNDLCRMALSPDGNTLAVVRNKQENSGTVYFYATATGKDLGSVKAQDGGVWCLAFSSDRQTLATGGMESTKEYGVTFTIRLWRLRADNKEWKEAGKLVGHQSDVWGLTFSPDGKMLASTGPEGIVRLWEVATGQERRRFAGHGGEGWCVAFAPDGRRLAAGSNDTTILVWDVTGRLQNGQLRPAKLSAQKVKSLWADLASADAARAGQAVWTLAAVPAQTLPLFQEHLRPVAPVGGQRLARLIADLDSDTFAVRQKAMDELTKLGEVAELALCQALAKPASLEMRRRLEQLLQPLEKEKFLFSGKELRSLRALEVLGQIGTSEALALLEELAQGAPGARQTREAQAVLKWLRTRVNETKP